MKTQAGIKVTRHVPASELCQLYTSYFPITLRTFRLSAFLHFILRSIFYTLQSITMLVLHSTASGLKENIQIQGGVQGVKRTWDESNCSHDARCYYCPKQQLTDTEKVYGLDHIIWALTNSTYHRGIARTVWLHP